VSKASRTALALVGALLLAAPEAAGGLAVGVAVPDFGMTTLEGRRFSLAEAEKTHSGVVILFLSTICPYSNYYNDLIRDMTTEFGKRGVAFVGVNSGRLETVDEIRTHARAHGHVFDIIKTLKPSGRGELEITDVNNAYIADGTLTWDLLEGWWTDAGTIESLHLANQLVAKTGANKL